MRPIDRVVHKLSGQGLGIPCRSQRSSAPLPAVLLQHFNSLFNLAHGFRGSNGFNLGSLLSAGNATRQHKPKKRGLKGLLCTALDGLED